MSGPVHAVTDDRGNRTYQWGGRSFVSVTTILSGGVPKYLVPWASKLVAEYAFDHQSEWTKLGRESAVALLKAVPNNTRDAAANLGKDIHAAAEAHILGTPMPEWPEAIAPALKAFERWLAVFEPQYQATEASVFSRQYGYAGTADAWFTLTKGPLAGKPLIVDYKSGRQVYSEVALQLSAYSRCDFLAGPDRSELPLPPTEGGAVLHVRPDGCVLREVDISDRVFTFFRYVQQVYRWAKEASLDVIGEPVSPELESELAASLRAVAA